MSLGARLTLVAAAAVAAVVVVLAPATYLIVRSQLYDQVDQTLSERADAVQHVPLSIDRGDRNPHLNVPGPALGAGGTYIQVYEAESGDAYQPIGQGIAVPVTDRVRETAGGDEERERHFENGSIHGVPVRQLVVPLDRGYALQVMQSIADTQSTLDRIRNLLIVAAVAGIGVAGALGLIVARTALRPVRRMTQTAERVSVTRDLTERIAVDGNDEIGRLAGAFNEMLGALEQSSRAQRQLVADASHELRTPLTSLRTNVEVLGRERELPAGERERLLDDVVEQLGEMTALIGELTELARGEQQREPHEDVRLDLLAAEAARRARRNHPNVEIDEKLAESMVVGAPAALERAIANLLDNAAKWSPPGGKVELGVEDGEVTVRDRGSGIADSDLPHVFDRFYRADDARSMPGSGLGLAIVRQVAEQHGGTVAVERPEGGGTLVRLRV
jgi:two-component system sensor histidine kinase MprB